jgi:hypothetical protein
MLRFNRALRYFLIAVGVFILYSGFTYSAIQDRSIAYRLFYAVFYLFFALGAGLIGGFFVSALGVLLGKGKGLLGEHQLTLTGEGLEETTAYNRSLNTWAGMRGVRQTGAFYFLFVTENHAHLVPRKKPLLEGDRDAFIQELRERLKRPNQSPEPTVMSVTPPAGQESRRP